MALTFPAPNDTYVPSCESYNPTEEDEKNAEHILVAYDEASDQALLMTRYAKACLGVAFSRVRYSKLPELVPIRPLNRYVVCRPVDHRVGASAEAYIRRLVEDLNRREVLWP